uniref:Uncharacterized protein n=1 Tax=Timema poppense TaxID=170557 RepID=A0A7R9DJJ0_TIMPO|nr:unnamed protein product [Timema poppensis]
MCFVYMVYSIKSKEIDSDEAPDFYPSSSDYVPLKMKHHLHSLMTNQTRVRRNPSQFLPHRSRRQGHLLNQFKEEEKRRSFESLWNLGDYSKPNVFIRISVMCRKVERKRAW